MNDQNDSSPSIRVPLWVLLLLSGGGGLLGSALTPKELIAPDRFTGAQGQALEHRIERLEAHCLGQVHKHGEK